MVPLKAYVPENAKWYLAEIVEEIRVKGERKNVIHINMNLLRADSPEEAYEKAIELGKDSEISYENTDGKLVTIRFRGLRDLWVIIDQLEHGAELAYEEWVGRSEKQIAKLIRSKEQLYLFHPREKPGGTPNNMSKDIYEELRKHFTDEELFGEESAENSTD
jgi:hypothetical protein